MGRAQDIMVIPRKQGYLQLIGILFWELIIEWPNGYF